VDAHVLTSKDCQENDRHDVDRNRVATLINAPAPYAPRDGRQASPGNAIRERPWTRGEVGCTGADRIASSDSCRAASPIPPHTFSSVTGTVASVVVRGLTNGRMYTFRRSGEEPLEPGCDGAVARDRRRCAVGAACARMHCDARHAQHRALERPASQRRAREGSLSRPPGTVAQIRQHVHLAATVQPIRASGAAGHTFVSAAKNARGPGRDRASNAVNRKEQR